VARAVWARFDAYKSSLDGRGLTAPVRPSLADVAVTARGMDTSPVSLAEFN
jgi:hypothetical protein